MILNVHLCRSMPYGRNPCDFGEPSERQLGWVLAWESGSFPFVACAAPRTVRRGHRFAFAPSAFEVSAGPWSFASSLAVPPVGSVHSRRIDRRDQEQARSWGKQRSKLHGRRLLGRQHACAWEGSTDWLILASCCEDVGKYFRG